MKYISKGMVIRASTEDLLFVTRCGVDFQLTGEQAALWLNGRFGFAKNRENVPEVKALQQLKRKGLVEITEGDEPVFEYRALTQCVLTPAKPQGVRAILSARQKELLLWLTEAGLRLTTAELVFLTEHHVAPQINLLGDRNRQNLTETIYTQETIFDNILEAQMEHAAARSYRSTSWTDDQFSAPHTCSSCREAAQPIRSSSHTARKSAARRFIGLFSFLQDGACPVSCVIYAATAAISSRPVSFQRFWVEISVKVPMDGWIRVTV